MAQVYGAQDYSTPGTDPYALTPDLIQAYTQRFGAPPSAGAQAIFNAENANYSAGNPNASGNVAGSGLPSNSSSAGSPGFFQTLGNLLTQPGLQSLLEAPQIATTTTNVATSAAQTATSFWGLVTDLPRMATMVIGLILIIAGIFALSRGPAVQVISSAAKTALTS